MLPLMKHQEIVAILHGVHYELRYEYGDKFEILARQLAQSIKITSAACEISIDFYSGAVKIYVDNTYAGTVEFIATIEYADPNFLTEIKKHINTACGLDLPRPR